MAADPARVRNVFLSATDLPPAARPEYLADACGADSVLRAAVERLLAAHERPDSLLDCPDTEGVVTSELDSKELQALEGDDLSFLSPSQEPGSLGRLDHYEVLAVVGRGGMGIVLKARDATLQRIVAIKVLAPALATSGLARRRFVREAQAAAAIRDEHVVGIHAVQADGLAPYLVMEFISGRTLEDRIRQGAPVEPMEVLRLGIQSARGLAAAHAQGLVHRDVKPANILLENGVQRVKLTDFGLARAVDDASLTRNGVIAGTPLYMSPEQARGESVDHRTDLFSLGSVLYTLCAGRAAFRAGNTAAVLRRVCEDTPRPIREVNPEIPVWLCRIIDKLMAKDPADRFQGASEIADRLGQYLASLQQPDQVPPPAEHLSARSHRWKRPLAAAAGVLVLLLAVGAGGYLSISRGSRLDRGGGRARSSPSTCKRGPSTRQIHGLEAAIAAHPGGAGGASQSVRWPQTVGCRAGVARLCQRRRPGLGHPRCGRRPRRGDPVHASGERSDALSGAEPRRALARRPTR